MPTSGTVKGSCLGAAGQGAPLLRGRPCPRPGQPNSRRPTCECDWPALVGLGHRIEICSVLLLPAHAQEGRAGQRLAINVSLLASPGQPGWCHQKARPRNQIGTAPLPALFPKHGGLAARRRQRRPGGAAGADAHLTRCAAQLEAAPWQ